MEVYAGFLEHTDHHVGRLRHTLQDLKIVVTKNKSYSVTAEVEIPTSGAKGVIIARGSTNGWSLYAKDGRLKHCYNFLGWKLFFAETTHPIPVGTHQVRMEFKYDGGGLAKGGTVSVYVDGKHRHDGTPARCDGETVATPSDPVRP